MDWQTLDGMIDELERLISQRTALIYGLLNPPRGSTTYFTPTVLVGFTRNDWRPVWAQAKEIQAAFNAKIRYPTGQQRQSAWVRFNDLRNKASEASRIETEKFSFMSQEHRDEIVALARSADCQWSDIYVYNLFQKSFAEDMRTRSAALKEAGQLLTKNKGRMLREHKDECFSVITEVRGHHDDLWERWKASLADRRREREERHAAAEERRADIEEKLKANLAANLERLEKVQDALQRNEAHIDDLREKLSSARSEEWRERFGEWLSEAEDKRRSMLDSESRFEEWVAQSKERLRDFESRYRRY